MIFVSLINTALTLSLLQEIYDQKPSFATPIAINSFPPQLFAIKRSFMQNISTMLSDSFPFPSMGKCVLAKSSNVSTLLSKYQPIEQYFRSLFETIDLYHRGTNEDIELNSFDLWHAHLVYSLPFVGLLFHSKEYPKLSKEFPYPLGFCQSGSNVTLTGMSRRNFLWVWNEKSTKAFLFQIQSGSRNILGVAPFYTIQEQDLGTVVSDLYYYQEKLTWSLY
jgi:hypothetical protein